MEGKARIRDDRGVEGGRVAGLLLGERRTALHPAGQVSRGNGPAHELRGDGIDRGRVPHSARRWSNRVLGLAGRGQFHSRRGVGPLALFEVLLVRQVKLPQQFLAALLSLVTLALFESRP